MAIVTLFLCYACLSHLPASSAGTPAFESMKPSMVYGNTVSYTISRNGKKIGSHTVEFLEAPNSLEVQVSSRLTVKVLKIPVYRFDYSANERWSNGDLQSVQATVREKGKTRNVKLYRDGDSITIFDAEGNMTRESVAFASNHWHPGVLSATKLFNTLTGKINTIDVENIGEELLEVNGSMIRTDHYRYSNQLRADVWYDRSQRWIKLAFEGSDGSNIEYLSNGFNPQ